MAVSMGQDSDSIASVVGAICGAKYGLTNGATEMYKEIAKKGEEYICAIKAYRIIKEQFLYGTIYKL